MPERAEVEALLDLAVAEKTARGIFAQQGRPRALRVIERVDRCQRDDGLLIEVVDNGRGAAPGAPGGRGLSNMRTRASRLGAQLEVDIGQQGARIMLALPLRVA